LPDLIKLPIWYIQKLAGINNRTSAGIKYLISMLRWMNAMYRYHVIEYIKTIVVNEDYDPAMERQILTYSSPTDFKNFYSNRFVPVEDRHVPMGTFWFKNPNRRQYKGQTFMPGESSPYQGHYNLWGGFV